MHYIHRSIVVSRNDKDGLNFANFDDNLGDGEVEKRRESGDRQRSVEENDGEKNNRKVLVLPELLDDFCVHPIHSIVRLYNEFESLRGFPPFPDILRQCRSEYKRPIDLPNNLVEIPWRRPWQGDIFHESRVLPVDILKLRPQEMFDISVCIECGVGE